MSGVDQLVERKVGDGQLVVLAPPWSCRVRSPPRWFGLTWFLVRLSAPAWKWHEPQDWTPSLPTCMSQNKALPSAAAAFLATTFWSRLPLGSSRSRSRAAGTPARSRGRRATRLERRLHGPLVHFVHGVGEVVRGVRRAVGQIRHPQRRLAKGRSAIDAASRHLVTPVDEAAGRVEEALGTLAQGRPNSPPLRVTSRWGTCRPGGPVSGRAGGEYWRLRRRRNNPVVGPSTPKPK